MMLFDIPGLIIFFLRRRSIYGSLDRSNQRDSVEGISVWSCSPLGFLRVLATLPSAPSFAPNAALVITRLGCVVSNKTTMAPATAQAGCRTALATPPVGRQSRFYAYDRP
jgi:hypothetical protein